MYPPPVPVCYPEDDLGVGLCGWELGLRMLRLLGWLGAVSCLQTSHIRPLRASIDCVEQCSVLLELVPLLTRSPFSLVIAVDHREERGGGGPPDWLGVSSPS